MSQNGWTICHKFILKFLFVVRAWYSAEYLCVLNITYYHRIRFIVISAFRDFGLS